MHYSIKKGLINVYRGIYITRVYMETFNNDIKLLGSTAKVIYVPVPSLVMAINTKKCVQLLISFSCHVCMVCLIFP